MGYEPRGRGFESCQARHQFKGLGKPKPFLFGSVPRRFYALRHHLAEGVETRAHWDLPQGLGFDIAQGYFIAKPMEAAAFQQWALYWRPPK